MSREAVTPHIYAIRRALRRLEVIALEERELRHELGTMRSAMREIEKELGPTR